MKFTTNLNFVEQLKKYFMYCRLHFLDTFQLEFFFVATQASLRLGYFSKITFILVHLLHIEKAT